MRKICSKISNF